MRPLGVLGIALLVGAAAPGNSFGQSPPTPDYVSAAIASPGRPKADVDRDTARKPAELVVFAGLRPGEKVADLMPGGGYFTRIFSKVVGTKGKVFALIPSELAQVAPKSVTEIQGLAALPSYANVMTRVQPTAALDPGEPVDIAWTSDNYHDLYGFFGPDQAEAFDMAVYRMVKPGGAFIVIDHAAAPGAPDVIARTLHRIDPAIVERQVIAAGFVLESRSPVLSNPADTHQLIVFDPQIRGRTDQFILKFRKPRG